MDISYLQEKRSIITIYVNGEVWRNVHTSLYGKKFSLGKDFCTVEDLERYFDALEYERAKFYAFKSLSARSMHSEQLRKALSDRLVTGTTINRVIDMLIQSGYLKDQEWIDSFVRIQTSRRVGPLQISQKLQSKGVAKEYIGLALTHIKTSESQVSSINHLLKTRYKTRNLADFKERQKVAAALFRKGFSFDSIQSALREFGTQTRPV